LKPIPEVEPAIDAGRIFDYTRLLGQALASKRFLFWLEKSG